MNTTTLDNCSGYESAGGRTDPGTIEIRSDWMTGSSQTNRVNRKQSGWKNAEHIVLTDPIENGFVENIWPAIVLRDATQPCIQKLYVNHGDPSNYSMYDAKGHVADGFLSELLVAGFVGGSVKIATFAKAGFNLISERNLWSLSDISYLVSLQSGTDFKTHGIPVLKKKNGVPNETKINGHSRYYEDVVFSIQGADYYLTKEWFNYAYDVVADWFLNHNLTLKDIVARIHNKGVAMYRGKFGDVQKIVYGAPGTGKSFQLNTDTTNDENVFRVTFHPDSDYASFVGAYKPTKESERITYNFCPQAFARAYVTAWREMSKGNGGAIRKDNVKTPLGGLNNVMSKVAEAFKGQEKSRKEIIDKAMEISGGEHEEKSFIPSDYCYNRVNGAMTLKKPALFVFLGDGKYQCLGFNDATYNGDIIWAEKYGNGEKKVGTCTNGVRVLDAEEPGKSVVLVIEEINRGNCAQIFGDLFQLLDRDDEGYSMYPINADIDLAKWLAESGQFGEDGLEIEKPTNLKMRDADWAAVMKGKKLALPPMLNIWATMNTSDQSLFPMDSAFKRRWDWKYVPIVEGKDKNGNKLGWSIEVKAQGAGKTRNWWDFIRRINIIIGNVTQSEDKKLGYFFAKPKDGGTVIDEETFVNKVVFYLWNEVLKDCPEDDENIAELQLDFDGTKRLPKFVDFFNVENNGEINSKRVMQLLDAVENVQLQQEQEKQAAGTASPGAN